MGSTLLAAERASLAAKAVVLLPALRVVLLDIAVESIVMRGHSHNACLLLRVHLHRVLVKALVSLGSHALAVARLTHHFLFRDFRIRLSTEVVLHALMHVVDKDSVSLLNGSLFLWALASEVIAEALMSVLFAKRPHIVVFGVQATSNA